RADAFVVAAAATQTTEHCDASARQTRCAADPPRVAPAVARRWLPRKPRRTPPNAALPAFSPAVGAAPPAVRSWCGTSPPQAVGSCENTIAPPLAETSRVAPAPARGRQGQPRC